MVGLVINSTKHLESTNLFKSVNPDTCELKVPFSNVEYTYELKIVVTGDVESTISACTQMLIDDGCTTIIYLGTCTSDKNKNKVFNVIDYDSDKIESNSNHILIKYIEENVVQSIMHCNTKNEVEPYDQLSASVLNVCTLNRVQCLLMLSNNEDNPYKDLGDALSIKLQLILKTDYEYYDKDKDSNELFSNAAVDAFEPVRKPEYLMSLPSKFKNTTTNFEFSDVSNVGKE